ncbi:transducin/WD40 repeat-like superfamily protein [Wolffia australiana]
MYSYFFKFRLCSCCSRVAMAASSAGIGWPSRSGEEFAVEDVEAEVSDGEDEEENAEEESYDEDYTPPGGVADELESADANSRIPAGVVERRRAESRGGTMNRDVDEGRGSDLRWEDEFINVSEDSENEQPKDSAKRMRKEKEDSSLQEQFNVKDLDLVLPNCPICMERWTGQGSHRVCCIPCGHLYGRSCLERWVKRCGESFVRCPQCKKSFKVKEIVNLYAPQVSVLNDELEKELNDLRKRNESLEIERKKLLDEVNKFKKYNEELKQLKKTCTRRSFPGSVHPTLDDWLNESQITPERGRTFLPPNTEQEGHSFGNIILQNEFQFDGARVVNIDAYSQVLLISGKSLAWREGHSLTKISLLCPYAVQNINLSDDTGAVRDLQFSPMNAVLPGRLALLASLGRKLSVFSMESNSIVLKYNLPGPAWSCSWDCNSPSHIYAGLQNGMVLTFDIRQTSSPVESRPGLSFHPVHTIHSLRRGSPGELLTASAMGPCLWAGNEATPYLVPDLENQGVCISLACGSGGGTAVATFRPRVCSGDGTAVAQSSQGHVRLGTHVLLKRDGDGAGFRRHDVACGNVSDVRMCRSAVVAAESNHVRGDVTFVYPDEACHGMGMWDVMPFQLIHRLKPHDNPILDVRFSEQNPGHGLLSCISETKAQVFLM